MGTVVLGFSTLSSGVQLLFFFTVLRIQPGFNAVKGCLVFMDNWAFMCCVLLTKTVFYVVGAKKLQETCWVFFNQSLVCLHTASRQYAGLMTMAVSLP